VHEFVIAFEPLDPLELLVLVEEGSIALDLSL